MDFEKNLTPEELAYDREEMQYDEILSVDDKERFLQEMLGGKPPSSQLLLDCLAYGAKECTRAIILDRGYLPPHYRNDYIYAGFALQFASSSLCDPLIIQIFIEECGYLPLVNCQFVGILPIHETLEQLSLSNHLEKWSVGKSIFKLLILLCLPKTRPILESLEVLVQYTRGIEEIACYCAMDGGVKELTALLLVARDKVLVPMSGAYERCFEHSDRDDEAVGVDISDMGKHRKCVYGLHSGLTISEHIMLFLGLPSYELEYLSDEYSYEEIEMSMRASLKILQVFEKAGHALEAYYLQSDQSNNVPVEEVIISIGLLLKKAGFHLEYKDIDLTDTHSLSEDVMEHICKKLEITRCPQLEDQEEDQGTKEHKFNPTPTQNSNSIDPIFAICGFPLENFRPLPIRDVPHGVCFPAYGPFKYSDPLVGRSSVPCRFYSSSPLTSKFCSSWRLSSSSYSFTTKTYYKSVGNMSTVESPAVNVLARGELVSNSAMRKIAQMVTYFRKKKGMWRV